MSNAEQLMRQALGEKFFHYIGKDEHEINLTESAIRKDRKQNTAPYMRPQLSERQKQAARERIKRLEELRKKQYLSGKYSFQRVIDIACFVYNIGEKDLVSDRRFQKLVRARQAIIVTMRSKRGLSWTDIGLRLGRDHSTVIHCYQSFKKDKLYEEFAARIEDYRSGQY